MDRGSLRHLQISMWPSSCESNELWKREREAYIGEIVSGMRLVNQTFQYSIVYSSVSYLVRILRTATGCIFRRDGFKVRAIFKLAEDGKGGGFRRKELLLKRKVEGLRLMNKEANFLLHYYKPIKCIKNALTQN